MQTLHLTHIVYATGVISLTDSQLSHIVSMAINARRTRRSLEKTLVEGGMPSDLQRALSKDNDHRDNAWLIANLHAIAERKPRPNVQIENEYHHALIDDAWAMQLANDDSYDPSTEDESTAESMLNQLKLKIRGYVDESKFPILLIDFFDQQYELHRTNRKLLAMSNIIGLEVRMWFATWASGSEISESDFQRVCALLSEQEHYLYVLGDSEKLAENFIQKASVNAQTNQFRDSVIYVHRAIIHAQRDELPYWYCQAYLIKLQIDEQLNDHKLVDESRQEIQRIINANSGESWTEKIRLFL